MTDPQLHRDLGRLEARVATLEKQLEQMHSMLSTVHETVTSARGSWKALVAVGALSAAVTAGVARVLSVIRFDP